MRDLDLRELLRVEAELRRLAQDQLLDFLAPGGVFMGFLDEKFRQGLSHVQDGVEDLVLRDREGREIGVGIDVQAFAA